MEQGQFLKLIFVLFDFTGMNDYLFIILFCGTVGLNLAILTKYNTY